MNKLNILLLISVMLLSACTGYENDVACVEADDWGDAKVTIPATIENPRAPEPPPYDSKQVITDHIGGSNNDLIITIDETSKWMPWFGSNMVEQALMASIGDKSEIKKLEALSKSIKDGIDANFPDIDECTYRLYQGTSADDLKPHVDNSKTNTTPATYTTNFYPDPTEEIDNKIPCVLKNGMGLYVGLAVQGSDDIEDIIITRHIPDAVKPNEKEKSCLGVNDSLIPDHYKYENGNQSEGIRKDIQCSIPPASGSGPGTPGILNLDGFLINGPAAQEIPGAYTGDRLYFKILDDFYIDNIGGYTIRIRQGTSGVNDLAVARSIADLVIAPLDGIMFGIYNAITQDDAYFINMIRMMLVLYLLFYGLSYILGFIKDERTDFIYRIIKFVIVIQIISPTSWDFFYNYLFDILIHGGAELASYIKLPLGGSGNGDIFASIDGMINALLSDEVHIKILSTLFSSPFGFLYIIILYMTLLYFFKALIQVFINTVVLFVLMAILIIMAPIFLSFILFGKLKPLFDEWINQFIAYSIQLIVVFAALAIFAGIVTHYMQRTIGYRVCWNNVYESPLGWPSIDFWQPSIRADKAGYDFESEVVSYDFEQNIANSTDIASLFSNGILTTNAAALIQRGDAYIKLKIPENNSSVGSTDTKYYRITSEITDLVLRNLYRINNYEVAEGLRMIGTNNNTNKKDDFIHLLTINNTDDSKDEYHLYYKDEGTNDLKKKIITAETWLEDRFKRNLTASITFSDDIEQELIAAIVNNTPNIKRIKPTIISYPDGKVISTMRGVYIDMPYLNVYDEGDKKKISKMLSNSNFLEFGELAIFFAAVVIMVQFMKFAQILAKAVQGGAGKQQSGSIFSAGGGGGESGGVWDSVVNMTVGRAGSGKGREGAGESFYKSSFLGKRDGGIVGSVFRQGESVAKEGGKLAGFLRERNYDKTHKEDDKSGSGGKGSSDVKGGNIAMASAGELKGSSGSTAVRNSVNLSGTLPDGAGKAGGGGSTGRTSGGGSQRQAGSGSNIIVGEIPVPPPLPPKSTAQVGLTPKADQSSNRDTIKSDEERTKKEQKAADNKMAEHQKTLGKKSNRKFGELGGIKEDEFSKIMSDKNLNDNEKLALASDYLADRIKDGASLSELQKIASATKEHLGEKGDLVNMMENIFGGKLPDIVADKLNSKEQSSGEQAVGDAAQEGQIGEEKVEGVEQIEVGAKAAEVKQKEDKVYGYGAKKGQSVKEDIENRNFEKYLRESLEVAEQNGVTKDMKKMQKSTNKDKRKLGNIQVERAQLSKQIALKNMERKMTQSKGMDASQIKKELDEMKKKEKNLSKLEQRVGARANNTISKKVGRKIDSMTDRLDEMQKRIEKEQKVKLDEDSSKLDELVKKKPKEGPGEPTVPTAPPLVKPKEKEKKPKDDKPVMPEIKQKEEKQKVDREGIKEEEKKAGDSKKRKRDDNEQNSPSKKIKLDTEEPKTNDLTQALGVEEKERFSKSEADRLESERKLEELKLEEEDKFKLAKELEEKQRSEEEEEVRRKEQEHSDNKELFNTVGEITERDVVNEDNMQVGLDKEGAEKQEPQIELAPEQKELANDVMQEIEKSDISEDLVGLPQEEQQEVRQELEDVIGIFESKNTNAEKLENMQEKMQEIRGNIKESKDLRDALEQLSETDDKGERQKIIHKAAYSLIKIDIEKRKRKNKIKFGA